jgi:hypothetical protein
MKGEGDGTKSASQDGGYGPASIAVPGRQTQGRAVTVSATFVLPLVTTSILFNLTCTHPFSPLTKMNMVLKAKNVFLE